MLISWTYIAERRGVVKGWGRGKIGNEKNREMEECGEDSWGECRGGREIEG